MTNEIILVIVSRSRPAAAQPVALRLPVDAVETVCEDWQIWIRFPSDSPPLRESDLALVSDCLRPICCTKMPMAHRGTQRGCIITLGTLFLPFLCSNGYPHRPFLSRNLILPNDSFIQSFTNNGSINITAKPVDRPQAIDLDFEDHLHVIVACSLTLLLVTLMGLFIRHHGLTLPPTNTQPQHTPNINTEDKRAVSGLGITSVRMPPAARVK